MRDEEIDRHPLVQAVTKLADELLAPQAAAVDAGTVPRSHLDALAAAGVLGMSAPGPDGAPAVPAAVARRVQELLAGADASTWFVQVQHHFPVRALAVADGLQHRLTQLAGGGTIAGIALSHLRRWPQRPVRATRVPGGWRLDGHAPWYTGWGLNDLALVAGASPDGQVVQGLVPAVAGPCLQPTALLRLAAMQATRTVALRFDALVIPDRDVVTVQPVAQWAIEDARPTVNANPACFGIALRALDLLAGNGAEPAEPAALAAATRIGERLRQVRAETYRLVDEEDPDQFTERRLDLRARAHQVMIAATTALVLAGAGRAMSADAPAQRLAREAMFMLIQAQTGPARAAALNRWGRR
jgi:alkylation response protein AidB-like acyl-CoA dehydrogenase